MVKKLFNKFKGENLPQSAMTWAQQNDVFRSGYGGWIDAYYKGDNPETATEWILVMDDGGYYKVGATYMTWYTNINGEVYAKANWSNAALNRTVKAILLGQQPPFDPNYQT